MWYNWLKMYYEKWQKYYWGINLLTAQSYKLLIQISQDTEMEAELICLPTHVWCNTQWKWLLTVNMWIDTCQIRKIFMAHAHFPNTLGLIVWDNRHGRCIHWECTISSIIVHGTWLLLYEWPILQLRWFLTEYSTTEVLYPYPCVLWKKFNEDSCYGTFFGNIFASNWVWVARVFLFVMSCDALWTVQIWEECPNNTKSWL